MKKLKGNPADHGAKKMSAPAILSSPNSPGFPSSLKEAIKGVDVPPASNLPDVEGESVHWSQGLALFSPIVQKTKGLIEIRLISPEEKMVGRYFSNNLADLGEFIRANNGINSVYFGPTTRINTSGGKKKNCKDLCVVYADLDFKDFVGGEEEPRTRLAEFTIQPSLVIITGGGLHVYWFLSETYDAQKHCDRLEIALKGLAKSLGGDKSVAQIAAMMRVPGTVNMKPGRNGALCQFEIFEPSRIVTLEKIESAVLQPKTAVVSGQLHGSLDTLKKKIAIGNRDRGSFDYVNAYIKQHGTGTDDEALEKELIEHLHDIGGDSLDVIKKKIPRWIESGHKFFDKRRKLTFRELADAFLIRFSAPVVYVSGQFLGYSDGHWSALDEKATIRRFITEFDGVDCSDTRTKQTLGVLRDLCAVESFESPRPLICLNDGTLDPVTGQLLPHSPDHHLQNALVCEWDPEAECNLWIKTLNEIFVGDPDADDKIRLLQMWFGYCLTPDNRHQLMLLLVGNGSNGKSLILDVMALLLGAENVSNAMISRLDSAFVRAELNGKLVNISPELQAKDTLGSSYLKQIVGGDAIEVERKYKPSFSFRPTVKLVAATNELPKLLDHSYGLARRLALLEFNRTFKESEKDRARYDKLRGELPGILRWAVDGLQTLREEQGFTIPESSLAALAGFRHDSNPVAQFAKDMLVADEGGKLTATDIRTRFVPWAEDRGYFLITVETLGRRLKHLGFDTRSSNGKNYWKVRFRSHSEMAQGG